jgi:outer membrane protein assembly factor BamB
VTINGTPTSVVFVGGGDTQFYALDASSGAVIWHTQVGAVPNNVIWSSPILYNGSVYTSTASLCDNPLTQGQIFRLDAATGAIQSTFNVVPNGCGGGGVWGSMSIDASNGTMYFATGTLGACSPPETMAYAIVQVNASNLALMSFWQVPAAQLGPDSDFGSTPTLFPATIGGTVHHLVGVANKNGIYYALDEANISNGPVWTATIAVGGQGPERGDGSISPSAWDGTNLYVGGGNTTIGGQSCQGGLRALNPATGAFIWERCMNDGPVMGAVTVVPGIVAVGEGTALWMMSTSDGHDLFKKWDLSTNSKYYAGPTIANGVVYITNKDGNFYAYGLPNSTTPTPTATSTATPTPTATGTLTPTPTPIPGTLAQDTFQRANQAHWGTASDGQTWAGDANSQSAFSIVSNMGQVANGNGVGYSAVLGPTATDAEVVFSGSISSFKNSLFGAVLRWSDGNNFYKALIDGNNLVIQKRVNGTFTKLSLTPFAATAGTSYSVRFRIVGTSLSAKAWQTGSSEPASWMVTATDSSLTSGMCGLHILTQSATAFKATSFVATTAQ